MATRFSTTTNEPPAFDFAKLASGPIDFATTRGRRLAASADRIDPTDPGVTPRQLRFIQALARECGMTDDELDGEARSIYGWSVAELSRRDASAYIERLQSRDALA